MINYSKALSMLSIATKAGKVVSGGCMVENAIQQGIAWLVIIAEDASDNTKSKFINKCTYYDVPYRICADGESLGRTIGKQDRKVVAVTDEGLANQIANKMDISKDMEV